MGASHDIYDLASYDYDLPPELIAQTPLAQRDASRLMLVDRSRGTIEHEHFSDVIDHIRAGDVLVTNDARVLHARTYGRRIPGGGRAEVFFMRPVDGDHLWEALVRPGRRLPPGASIELDGGVVVHIESRTDAGARVVRLPDGVSSDELFATCGRVPLPPYIKEELDDPERYQTVYSNAREDRSVAAPTAGLHFTPELLERIDKKNIVRASVTLDVGAGTFRPVIDQDVRRHVMHREMCRVDEGAARAIREARERGGRAVAVGTTAVRTLETFALPDGTVECGARDTDLYILPGRGFKVVDAMITNFHLPRSTLLMLVAAFAGYDLTMRAYREAVEERYRFFSFGDAMMIV